MEYIIGILAFIFVVMPLITLLINTFHIYGLKLVRCHFALTQKSKLKSYEKEMFDYGARPLELLGFQFNHFHKYSDIVQSVNQTDTTAVFWHPEHHVYAEISNPKNPDTSRPIACRFFAIYQSHTLIGMDREAEGVFKGCAQLNCIPLSGSGVGNMLDIFLLKKSGFEVSSKTTPCEQLNGAAYIKRMAADADEYLRYLLSKNWVYKKTTTDNETSSIALCFSFKAASKMSWQMMKDKSTHKLLKQEAHENTRGKINFFPETEAKAHQRANSLTDASKVKGFAKLMLFIGSVVFFGLVIGIAWEPLMVLLLAPVLMFHELGHFWAMKRFGYQDLQIMFLPIGAVALGKKESPTVLQKTWVALAGPVPGLLLALLIILWQPSFMVSIYGMGLIFMLVVINYLNLMPFMPLDGGHVVNTLLFDRWPTLQLLFKLLGVVVFAYFAWAWTDPILTFLAVFLAFGLANNWREYRIVTALKGSDIESLNEFNQLTKIYEHINQQNSLFQEKMVLVNAVMQRFRHAKPKIRETVLGMTVYLFFLIAPVVFIDKYMDMDLLALFSTENMQEDDGYYEYEGIENFNEKQWDINHYQERLDVASTAEDKKQIYQEAMTFSKKQEYGDFVMPLANDAVTLYENNNWQNEGAFKEWKRMALTSTIFENYEQSNKAEWGELKQLMSDDEPGFYQLVSQTMYSQKTHIFEPQFRSYMEQTKAANEWDAYVEMFLSLNVMKGNRGEVADKITSSEQLLTEIPGNEVYAISRIRNMYVLDLFTAKEYQKIIHVYESSSNKNSEQEFGDDMFLIHQVIWAAIELKQLEEAQHYIDQYHMNLEKQNEELMDSIGFLGRLALNQIDEDTSAYATQAMELALALINKNDKQAEQLLDDYLESSYESMPVEQQKQRLAMMVSASERDIQSTSDLEMKYIVLAIKKFKPEWLKNINEA